MTRMGRTVAGGRTGGGRVDRQTWGGWADGRTARRLEADGRTSGRADESGRGVDRAD